MKNILLCLALVLIYVHVIMEGVYGKTSKIVSKHGTKMEYTSKDIVENSTRKNDLALGRGENDKEIKDNESRDLNNDDNSGKQVNLGTVDKGTISTEDYLKSLTSALPGKDLDHTEAGENDGTKKVDKEKKKISSSSKANETRNENIVKASDEKKSNSMTTKKTNSEKNLNSPVIQGTDKKQREINLNSRNNGAKNKTNNNEKSFEQMNQSKEHDDHEEEDGDEIKTIDKPHISESKNQASSSVSNKSSHSSQDDKQKKKPLHSKSKTSADKSQNLGKSKTKKAKKILVSFFHSESDDKKLPEGAHGKKTHAKEGNEHGQKSTQNDLPSSHTRDEESTLAEISDRLYKRTGLQQQPPMANLNKKVIETVLPSGPNAVAPQHIRLSNEPTHVLFKPVHKYYPAIHRYMTKPIHRYLEKPVDLSGLSPQLEGDIKDLSSAQVKGYTAPPVVQQSIRIPQVGESKLTPISGGLGAQTAQVGGKQFNTPPTVVQQVTLPHVQSNVGQQVSNGLVNDGTQLPQAKHYVGNAGPRIVAGGLPQDHHLLPGAVGHVGPVRIFTQLPPRIQPVLIHPHRLSPTGL